MCDYRPVLLGKEETVDGSGFPPVYRHNFEGVLIRTHRTYRVSPAGWVWAVVMNGEQVAWGYQPTQRQALNEAAHRVSGPCGYVPRHRTEGHSSKMWEPPAGYTGRHVEGRLPRWAA